MHLGIFCFKQVTHIARKPSAQAMKAHIYARMIITNEQVMSPAVTQAHMYTMVYTQCQH